MTAKKVLGFVFVGVAILLTLGIAGQLIKLLETIVGLIKVISGSLDSYQTGRLVGKTLYWGAYITATIALWRYGVKWTRKRNYFKQSENE